MCNIGLGTHVKLAICYEQNLTTRLPSKRASRGLEETYPQSTIPCMSSPSMAGIKGIAGETF